MDRRHLLMRGAAVGSALWLPLDVREADARSQRKAPLAREGTFEDGVGSGDPAPTAMTFWTRLAGTDVRQARVKLVVATDPKFKRVVLRRRIPTTAGRDHTVKVRVGGLKPDTRYWYRFFTHGAESPIGRTQTAPAPGSDRAVKLGYFACQDFASGFYGAYRSLLAADPDFVVCGGDYIYDRVYDTDGYGGARPDTAGKDTVATTLADYRAKYRQARTDPDLKELLRLVPLVAQWDDHEVTDNYVGTLDQSGADDEDPRDVYDRARITAGHRAWHEFMPARSFTGSQADRTYRKLRLGRHVELFMLDSREYRDDQPCGGGSLQACDDDAPRQYLGATQLQWLKDGLQGSSASWKLVGNQQMIMPFELSPGVKVEVDSWQGYPAQRTELLTHVQQRGIQDVVFLTGDIHTFFAGEVRRDGQTGPAVATELVGGSTTSPGTAQTVGQQSGGVLSPDALKLLTDQIGTVNPWIQYADTRAHGVALVDLDGSGVRARYLASRDVLTQAGSRDVRQIADLRVARGRPGVDVASRAS